MNLRSSPDHRWANIKKWQCGLGVITDDPNLVLIFMLWKLVKKLLDKKTKCWFYHVLSCFIQQTCWNIQPTKPTFEWLSALATKGHCSFAVRRNSSEPEKSSAAVPQCLTPEAVTPRFRRCRIVLQCCSAYAESMCIFVHYTYNRGYNIIYIYIY